jgi:hypothetical protein
MNEQPTPEAPTADTAPFTLDDLPTARDRIATLTGTCDQLQRELARNAQVTWMLWLALAGLLGVAVIHHRQLMALLEVE